MWIIDVLYSKPFTYRQETKRLPSEGEQNTSPQNMLLSHFDYFELQLLMKQLVQVLPLRYRKEALAWEIYFLMWARPSYTWKIKGILIITDGKFKAEKSVQRNLVTSSLICYIKFKPLHLVSSSQIYCFVVLKSTKAAFFGHSLTVYLWGSCTYEIIFFSLVHLLYDNLIIRPAKEPRRDEGRVASLIFQWVI